MILELIQFIRHRADSCAERRPPSDPKPLAWRDPARWSYLLAGRNTHESGEGERKQTGRFENWLLFDQYRPTSLGVVLRDFGLVRRSQCELS